MTKIIIWAFIAAAAAMAWSAFLIPSPSPIYMDLLVVSGAIAFAATMLGFAAGRRSS